MRPYKILELMFAIYSFILAGFSIYGGVPYKHLIYWGCNIIGIILLICYDAKDKQGAPK